MKTFKYLLKKIRSKYIKASVCWSTILESQNDCLRYCRAATGRVDQNFNRLESDIIRAYHVLEKGLSMPSFKAGFGKKPVKKLQYLLKLAQKSFPQETLQSEQIEVAINVLLLYKKLHFDLKHEAHTLVKLEGEVSEKMIGGISPLEQVFFTERLELATLLTSRRSVRNFDDTRQPSKEKINDAVRIAIHTPSVCNRQAWRVHALAGEMAAKALHHQQGNRGFGHTVPICLVVTVDMSCFFGAPERYQPWIDGGMFGMNLLLALHAHGIGAVPLNWSVSNKVDKQFREDLEIISDSERIVMMIGCGYPVKNAVAPVSHRRITESVVTWS